MKRAGIDPKKLISITINKTEKNSRTELYVFLNNKKEKHKRTGADNMVVIHTLKG